VKSEMQHCYVLEIGAARKFEVGCADVDCVVVEFCAKQRSP